MSHFEVVPAYALYGCRKPDDMSRKYIYTSEAAYHFGEKRDFFTKEGAVDHVQGYKIPGMVEYAPYEVEKVWVIDGPGYLQVAIWYKR